MSKNTKAAEADLTNQIAAIEQRFGPIEYRPLDTFQNYSKNPRKHPERQLVKLMSSISEFGFVWPVLVDEDGTIIAGEARIIAAERLAMHEVPVIIAHHWSKAQVKAFRLADNRLAELATWDEEMLAIELAAIIECDETPIEILGWETAEIDIVLEGADKNGDEPNPADKQFDLPKVPIAFSGDLWLLGKHRLLCGSSLEVTSWDQLMAGETAAMACVDFPYNVPISGHVCGLGKVKHAEFRAASGEMSKAEFIQFLTDAIAAMLPHLKEGAVLQLFMDWRSMGEMLAALEANGLTLINLCVWNKTNGGMGSLYRSKHELVFIAKKGRVPHTNNVELGKHGRYRTNVWDYAGINSFGKNRMANLADHPTVKSTALVADAIRDVSHPGEIVLDSCLGSGTTILAAERTKRRCFGIEIEPGYVDVAIRRWETLAGTEAVLATSGQSFAEVAAERLVAVSESGNDEPANIQSETIAE